MYVAQQCCQKTNTWYLYVRIKGNTRETRDSGRERERKRENEKMLWYSLKQGTSKSCLHSVWEQMKQKKKKRKNDNNEQQQKRFVYVSTEDHSKLICHASLDFSLSNETLQKNMKIKRWRGRFFGFNQPGHIKILTAQFC